MFAIVSPATGRLDLEKARVELSKILDLVMLNSTATTEQKIFELLEEVSFTAAIDARRDELSKWPEKSVA